MQLQQLQKNTSTEKGQMSLAECRFIHALIHEASGVAMDCASCARHKGPRAQGAPSKL
jgi:hypothetical protein